MDAGVVVVVGGGEDAGRRQHRSGDVRSGRWGGEINRQTIAVKRTGGAGGREESIV